MADYSYLGIGIIDIGIMVIGYVVWYSVFDRYGTSLTIMFVFSSAKHANPSRKQPIPGDMS